MGNVKSTQNKIPEVILLDRRFKDIFGVRFLDYIDGILAKIGYGAHLDVVKFDDYLQAKYNDYIDGMSMKEFIEMKFGKDASQFIEELI